LKEYYKTELGTPYQGDCLEIMGGCYNTEASRLIENTTQTKSKIKTGGIL